MVIIKIYNSRPSSVGGLWMMCHGVKPSFPLTLCHLLRSAISVSQFSPDPAYRACRHLCNITGGSRQISYRRLVQRTECLLGYDHLAAGAHGQASAACVRGPGRSVLCRSNWCQGCDESSTLRNCSAFALVWRMSSMFHCRATECWWCKRCKLESS